MIHNIAIFQILGDLFKIIENRIFHESIIIEPDWLVTK